MRRCRQRLLAFVQQVLLLEAAKVAATLAAATVVAATEASNSASLHGESGAQPLLRRSGDQQLWRPRRRHIIRAEPSAYRDAAASEEDGWPHVGALPERQQRRWQRRRQGGLAEAGSRGDLGGVRRERQLPLYSDREDDPMIVPPDERGGASSQRALVGQEASPTDDEAAEDDSSRLPGTPPYKGVPPWNTYRGQSAPMVRTEVVEEEGMNEGEQGQRAEQEQQAEQEQTAETTSAPQSTLPLPVDEDDTHPRYMTVEDTPYDSLEKVVVTTQLPAEVDAVPPELVAAPPAVGADVVGPSPADQAAVDQAQVREEQGVENSTEKIIYKQQVMQKKIEGDPFSDVSALVAPSPTSVPMPAVHQASGGPSWTPDVSSQPQAAAAADAPATNASVAVVPVESVAVNRSTAPANASNDAAPGVGTPQVNSSVAGVAAPAQQPLETPNATAAPAGGGTQSSMNSAVVAATAGQAAGASGGAAQQAPVLTMQPVQPTALPPLQSRQTAAPMAATTGAMQNDNTQQQLQQAPPSVTRAGTAAQSSPQTVAVSQPAAVQPAQNAVLGASSSRPPADAAVASPAAGGSAPSTQPSGPGGAASSSQRQQVVTLGAHQYRQPIQQMQLPPQAAMPGHRGVATMEQPWAAASSWLPTNVTGPKARIPFQSQPTAAAAHSWPPVQLYSQGGGVAAASSRLAAAEAEQAKLRMQRLQDTQELQRLQAQLHSQAEQLQQLQERSEQELQLQWYARERQRRAAVAMPQSEQEQEMQKQQLKSAQKQLDAEGQKLLQLRQAQDHIQQEVTQALQVMQTTGAPLPASTGLHAEAALAMHRLRSALQQQMRDMQQVWQEQQRREQPQPFDEGGVAATQPPPAGGVNSHVPVELFFGSANGRGTNGNTAESTSPLSPGVNNTSTPLTTLAAVPRAVRLNAAHKSAPPRPASGESNASLDVAALPNATKRLPAEALLPSISAPPSKHMALPHHHGHAAAVGGRQTSTPPTAPTLVHRGRCSDVVGRIAIGDEAQCEATAAFFGVVWRGAGHYPWMPRGCVRTEHKVLEFNRDVSASGECGHGYSCVCDKAIASYSLVTRGGCPDWPGRYELESAEDCQAAAVALGLPWRGSGSWTNGARGCNANKYDGVRFNEEVVAQRPCGHADEACICSDARILMTPETYNKPQWMNLLAEDLSTSEEFELTFHLTPTGVMQKWSSILRVTATSTANGNHGDMMPAFFFRPASTRLWIGMGRDGDDNAGCDTLKALAIGHLVHITARLVGGRFAVYVDGEEVCSIEGYVNKYSAASKAAVWLGDAFHPPAKAMVSRLVYRVQAEDDDDDSADTEVVGAESLSTATAVSGLWRVRGRLLLDLGSLAAAEQALAKAALKSSVLSLLAGLSGTPNSSILVNLTTELSPTPKNSSGALAPERSGPTTLVEAGQKSGNLSQRLAVDFALGLKEHSRAFGSAVVDAIQGRSLGNLTAALRGDLGKQSPSVARALKVVDVVAAEAASPRFRQGLSFSGPAFGAEASGAPEDATV
eukprot:TRINITY_DN30876_c0_g1_i4.p1 TRINITY_DN30876_c0_g1~~TRINITY_DN30876_c0_g1_i4.p1  ORF type:complete len:1518 (-),score=433.78 TRINITY_DN30876_c0_g1_i4:272-4825(-)